MKIQEIRAKAKALQLKNTFGLSKAELIRRVQKAEGNFDCFGTAKGYCDQFRCFFREDCLGPSRAGTPVRSNSTRCALPYGLRGGLIHYDERRVHYGKTDSMGGIFNSDEGKGQERKEAYLGGLL
jgi:hypothetical protein